ncbi:MAG: hypothetical protein CVU05_12290 [Bacteroidetes bacterium HGW-Bacteroidetes-21]|jgi:flagellar hook assembly protein FlgD|nr:MAG: hypothetical protein CVU05_12290 [Bacteroidetes bacterium HGW-Bacteroidetes-21]
MKTKLVLGFILVIFTYFSVQSQNTPGTVTFKVTTVTDGGQFSPKNVIAIWVKNSSGTFVKTIKVMALQRIQYLNQWKTSSGLNTTDAITGSTLLSHQTHTVTWNCTNVSGSVVPDGNYDIWVEYADDDVSGPVAHYTFNKGTSSSVQNFNNQPYFINVSINYVPQSSAINESFNEEQKITVYQNSSGNFNFSVPMDESKEVNLKIFSITGQLLYEKDEYTVVGENVNFEWNPENSGKIFVYQIKAGNVVASGKILDTNY